MDKYLGKRLDGRYEIREIVGVGGMACVYKAYDTIDDRIVSVKILKDEYLANDEFTRRFKNESKAIAILSHPNIVKVYDVSFGDRFQYIVMEYIDGITLKEYIEQQKEINWKETLHFTVQILRALQHAHDKGIIHRDIKPQNIMLLPDGTIKVMDFGIAQFSRQEVRMTTSGENKAIGSVHYISPEQARGEITDEKADIYSVGVMLYEMLTGCLPFEADNAVSVAIMQLQAEPKKPCEINDQIPEGLEEITMKAMQKDPRARYQSAAEMLYDIDEFKRNPSIHFEYKYYGETAPAYDAVAHKTRQTQDDQLDDKYYDDDDEDERSSMAPVIIAICGALCLIALIFFGAKLFMGFLDGGSDNVIVPNLVGHIYEKEVQNNTEYLSNFIFKVEYEYSDTVDPGKIISQRPAGDREVKIKEEIVIVVSKGREKVQIPQIEANRTVENAKEKLKEAGFTNIQEVYEVSSEVPQGLVIRTEPAFPDEVQTDANIRLYISNGTEAVPENPVPDLINMAQEDAVKKLRELQFVIDEDLIEIVNYKGKDAGFVVDQTPAAGESMPIGTKVTLTVSSGFQDVALLVDLPSTSTAVDLQVYVDGSMKAINQLEVKDMNGNRLNSLSNLLPTDLKTIAITLTEQKESYPVTIRIRASDLAGNYDTYYSVRANGLKGLAEETSDGYKEFKDPYAAE